MNNWIKWWGTFKQTVLTASQQILISRSTQSPSDLSRWGEPAASAPLKVVAELLAMRLKPSKWLTVAGPQHWSRVEAMNLYISSDKASWQISLISALALRLPLSDLRHLTFMSLLLQRFRLRVAVCSCILSGLRWGSIMSASDTPTAAPFVMWKQISKKFLRNCGSPKPEEPQIREPSQSSEILSIWAEPAAPCWPQPKQPVANERALSLLLRQQMEGVGWHARIFLMEIDLIRRRRSFCRASCWKEESSDRINLLKWEQSVLLPAGLSNCHILHAFFCFFF